MGNLAALLIYRRATNAAAHKAKATAHRLKAIAPDLKNMAHRLKAIAYKSKAMATDLKNIARKLKNMPTKLHCDMTMTKVTKYGLNALALYKPAVLLKEFL